LLLIVVLPLTGTPSSQHNRALCEVPSIELVPCWACEAEVRDDGTAKLEPWGKASHICARIVHPVGTSVNVHESAHGLAGMPGAVYSGFSLKDPDIPILKEAKAE
jgi:hypothetical protein